MSTVAIVQARMGSVRFPNKVARPIAGTPMVELLLARLGRARRIDAIIVAMPDSPANDPLADLVTRLGIRVYRGSEDDVLDRYYRAAELARPERVVRITADCPLVDPALVDRLVDHFDAQGVDYVSNTDPPSFPDGLDAEVMSFAALRRAWEEARQPHEREHVTPYLRESGKFRTTNLANPEDLSAERWTVDEPEDFEVVQNVFRHFAPRRDFTWLEVLELKRAKPELFAANLGLARNEGVRMGTGQKLWKRAKRLIPGGSMLLSKRAEMFLPEQWPAYFSRAKGCRVWDLDGREYIDMCIMGIGTNTLGYGRPEVDDAVRRTVGDGNMSTLNCPEEVWLAERLVELHPWADMARFARSGGEANAIAIRIARAASGRDGVAICGYHGWHDWYLSANLADDRNLDGHLLPGLEPRGVPRNLRGTVFPFNYNRLDELEALVAANDIGVIKMEVARNFGPEAGFLEGVRSLATRKGIVLVFDECTSGFRETFGGLHLKYGVEPDLAILGKALGNGYAVTGTIGRREVMQAAQSTFISSTFWTERIGSAAALATLKVMEEIESWRRITAIGERIVAGWRDLGRKHGIDIQVAGIPAIASFSIASPDWLKYKTLITQEMLKQGYLASNLVYACTEHTPQIVDDYLARLDPILALVRECAAGRPIDPLLEGPVCHGGFHRLN